MVCAYVAQFTMYITDIEVNDGRKSAIFKLIFFKAYPSLKAHFFVVCNGLAIWHSFPDITHIKVNNGLKSTI